jgi:hypothetical protein
MSTISAGNTLTTGFVASSDTTGNLAFQTNGTTTALTLNTSQNANFVGSVTSVNTFGFENRIINGAMMIDQRNSGTSVNVQTTTTYTLDRWTAAATQNSKFSIQQNAGAVTTPAGFINYLGATSSSAYSVITTDYFSIGQFIEGLNVADLAWGTANAKTVTLSAWVRSSLTGTFGGALQNSASNYCYPFTYTISSANTWTQISVTINGPTAGTWLTTNGTGIKVFFNLGTGATYSGTAGSWAAATYISATGATSVVGTNGATFYVTGVQLEVGTQATNFDFRDYGRELILCQRYCFFPAPGATYVGGMNGTTGGLVTIPFPVIMRTAPTGTIAGTWTFDNYTSNFTTSSVALQNSSTTACRIYGTSLTGGGGAANQAFEVGPGNTGTIILSAEL